MEKYYLASIIRSQSSVVYSKEYRTKRDEVSYTNQIPKDKIGKGLISLIFKGLVVKEKENYSIDDNLLPYFKKRIILEYIIAVRETCI